MSVRPPSMYRTSQPDNPVTEALEQEIFEEKAGTLTRLNKKLEAALDSYRAELAKAERDTTDDPAPETLLLARAEAGEALWHVIIQRELCGLRSHQTFLNHMQVPREIRLSAGPVPQHLKQR